MSSKGEKGPDPISYTALLDENRALKDLVANQRLRLEEAEELKRAITEGDLDALVFPGPKGNLTFTLDSADHAYRTLVETMNEGTATLSFDGTILYCNSRFAALLRMPLQSIVGTSIYQFISPEHYLTFKALLEHEMDRGEITLLTEGGISLPVYLSISSLRTKESPNAWCLVVTDLTEQKKNEEIIAEAHLTQSVIDQAGEIIIVCDTSGRIIRFSNNISKAYGGDPTFQRFEDIINLRFSVGEDADKSIYPIISTLNGSAILGMEATIELEDCQKVYFLLNSKSLKNVAGEIIGCLVTLTDITERKQTEYALRESDERLRLIQKSSGIGSWEQDIDGGPSLWSPEQYTILGLDPATCFPSHEAWKSTVFPENLELAEDAIRKAIATKSTLDFDYRIVLPDGSLRWLAARGGAGINSAGQPVLRGINLDITERKLREQQLYNTNHRLEALLNALPVGISFSNDPTCKSITGNPTLLAQFDARLDDNISASAPEDNALGRQVRFFLDGRQISDIELPLQRAIAEKRRIPPMELEVEMPSGRRWFTETSGAPICDMENNVVAGVAITMDITKRKNAEAKLKETLDNLENLVKERTTELEKAFDLLKKSEKDLAEAQKISHVGNWNWNIVTNEISWSDETYRIFGVDPQEFVPTYNSFLSYVHPED